MSKIIKLKQSDLTNIIDKVLREQLDNPEPQNNNSGDDNYGEGEELKLGQDQFGNYYIFDDDGNIIEKA
jgi:hypothetical protein